MNLCKKVTFLKILIILTVINVDAVANSDSKQDAKCLLPREPGPCRMRLSRFYYNAKTDTCEEFVFGGCKGNDNKFGFKQTCEAACKKSTIAATSTATTESLQNANQQLKSDTLRTNYGASSTTTTTPKPVAAPTTVKTKSFMPTIGTTTTQKSNRF